jgi:hypothetical protein
MPFNASRFAATKLVPRTAKVAVPGLLDFFDPEDAQEWTVRGVTGQELGQAKAATAARKDLAALVDKLLGGQPGERAEAVRSLFGLNEEVPPDIALRIHLLRIGSVDPVVDEDLAVKLCTCFPIEFSLITQKILELTGAGYEPGKAGASGETPESGAH